MGNKKHFVYDLPDHLIGEDYGLITNMASLLRYKEYQVTLLINVAT